VLRTLIKRIVLWLPIRLKWRRDCRRLPLVRAQFEQYANIHVAFWWSLFRFPNLVAPQSRNDMIQWMKLFDYRPESVTCCDKIAMRDIVQARVGARYLVTLYQVHEHFDGIDFAALPRACVIKTNHNSGPVFLVRDHTRLDRARVRRQIERKLREVYGWEKGEWAYASAPPKVLVEEHLAPDDEAPPADYKFHCDGGRVTFCAHFTDRHREARVQHIARDGTPIPGGAAGQSYAAAETFVKPPVWDEMVTVAERLAEGFQLLRVDLYCVGERICVGELTLWPGSGFARGVAFNTAGNFGAIDFTRFRPVVVPPPDRTGQSGGWRR
jgi:hypothetical protein